MTDKQKQKELEEMAEVIENALRENSVNYRDPYTGQPRAYYNTQAMDVSAALIEAHYRPEAEVRAEAVKEFAEKAINSLNKYCYITRQVPFDAGFIEGIKQAQATLMDLAEQYGKEEKTK